MVEVDSDIEYDFKDADFNYFDLNGDGIITMRELITKLNPSASILEKEELAAIVSSAPNFDLDKDGNINLREMITKLNPSKGQLISKGLQRSSNLPKNQQNVCKVFCPSQEVKSKK